MKKTLLLCLLALVLGAGFARAQTVTPNIGLQIPNYNQPNWQVPINYDLNRLDLLLSGNLPLPALNPLSLMFQTQVFSALPACTSGINGDLEAVSDSTTQVWGATITGGGSSYPVVWAYCNGTNWVVAPYGGGGFPIFSNPMTTEGDFIYQHSGVAARLPVGTNGQCVISNGSDPLWGSCSQWLGNGTTVIDLANNVAGSTEDAKLQTAITACGLAGRTCTFDGRGLISPQAFNSTVTLPANSEFIPSLGEIDVAGGAKILTNNTGASILGHGQTTFEIQKSDNFIECTNGSCGNITIDGIKIQNASGTNISGPAFAITSVDVATTTTLTMTAAAAPDANGAQVYTGTISSGSWTASASVTSGFFTVTFTGFAASAGANNGTFQCSSWTSTTITCENSAGVAETHSGTATVGVTTYHGTITCSVCPITSGAGSAFAGYQFGIIPTLATFKANTYSSQWGYYMAVKSSATTLVLLNGGAAAATAAFLAQPVGGWAIYGPYEDSHFNNVTLYGVDNGIYLGGSGCNCSNTYNNLYVLSSHGAFFADNDANSNTMSGFTTLQATDLADYLKTAAGYGFIYNGEGGWTVDGLSIINTRFPMILTGDDVLVRGWTDFENSYLPQLPADGSTNPLLIGRNENIAPGVDCLDISNSFSYRPTNQCGTQSSAWPLNPDIYGSISTNQLPTPIASFSAVGGTGTTYHYYLIGHDYNDNLTLPSVDAPLSGGASLSTSVYNVISFTLPGSGRGAKCYDIMKGDTAHLLIGCVLPVVLQNGVRDDGSYSTTTPGGYPPTRNATGDATINGDLTPALYSSISNCNVNSVSPAACGSAPNGVFVIPTATTTYTVNTTAVGTNSRIFLQPTTDATGITGSPTCVAPLLTTDFLPSARTAGTSFTMTLTSTTGTTCWNYWIINQ